MSSHLQRTTTPRFLIPQRTGDIRGLIYPNGFDDEIYLWHRRGIPGTTRVEAKAIETESPLP